MQNAYNFKKDRGKLEEDKKGALRLKGKGDEEGTKEIFFLLVFAE